MKQVLLIMISVAVAAFSCAKRNMMTTETTVGSVEHVQHETELSQKGVNEVARDMVRCNCSVLEIDLEYLYCDYDDVPEGSDSSIGTYPWLKVKIDYPAEFEGREFEIVFESGMSETDLELIDEKNRNCTIDLPQDFLEGKFKRIIDSSIERFSMKKSP